MKRIQLLFIAVLATALGCGGAESPPKAPEPAVEKKETPPPEKKPPQKTPEQIAAEKKAAREKEIAGYLAEIHDEKADDQARFFAFMRLSHMDPMPEEAVAVALEVLKSATGEPPPGPDPSRVALDVVRKAGPETPGLVDAVLAFASDPAKGGLLKGDLIALVGDFAPPDKGIPVLIEALKDEMRFPLAMDGLVKYGAPSVDPLIAVVRDPESGNRRSGAMQALARIGADAARAVPVILEVAVKAEFLEAAVAFKALGDFGPVAREAVPELEKIAAENGPLSRSAKEALGKIR